MQLLQHVSNADLQVARHCPMQMGALSCSLQNLRRRKQDALQIRSEVDTRGQLLIALEAILHVHFSFVKVL